MAKTLKVIAPTVNSEEMFHYKFLSTSWWNKENTMDILHVLNDLRIPWILNTLVETGLITKDATKHSKPLRELSILDVGCGGLFQYFFVCIPFHVFLSSILWNFRRFSNRSIS